MKPFDIFIVFVSWGSGGKSRPVLVYALNGAYARVFPITTQYDKKSDAVKERYFKINDWATAGLNAQSYIDTGTRLKQPLAMFENIEPVGALTERDKRGLLKFITG